MFSLVDRTAVVTGGGSGIGRAMAGALADTGAAVVLVGRDLTRLEDACREIGAAASPVVANLGIASDIERLCEDVGAVDVLVNAAAINLRPHPSTSARWTTGTEPWP